jgi:stage V sporulation protein SpoVS
LVREPTSRAGALAGVNARFTQVNMNAIASVVAIYDAVESFHIHLGEQPAERHHKLGSA